MSILKQRVPMANIEGSRAYITTEWLKDLQTYITDQVSTTTTTTTAAPTVTVSADDFAALVARVKKLEGGYQA